MQCHREERWKGNRGIDVSFEKDVYDNLRVDSLAHFKLGPRCFHFSTLDTALSETH